MRPRESMATRKAPVAGALDSKWWTVGDSRIRCADAHPSLASSVGRNPENVPPARFLNGFPPHRFESPRVHGNKKGPRCGSLGFQMVDRRGLEPRTLGLRVPCSTN